MGAGVASTVKGGALVAEIARHGHAVENHSYGHRYDLSRLSRDEILGEIERGARIIERVTGRRPVGFRSPGWNMGDEALPILKRRGYVYDSSIHPMLATPAFKALHWLSTSACEPRDRTTLGQWSYMFAPLRPYRTDASHLARRGNGGAGGLVEFPISVVPGISSSGDTAPGLYNRR